MQVSQLIFRNLKYFWRTNLAVILGVATAVSVLSGALLVGDSVRESLHDLILKRIGQTDYVISSSGYFEESLSVRLKQHPRFTAPFRDACPMIVKEGMATHQLNRRRVNDVRIYGVSAQFWSFNLLDTAPDTDVNGRNVLIGSSLAAELRAQRGDSILLRLEAPGEIPLEYLMGRKEKLGKTLRVRISDILTDDQLGSFALRPSQGVIHSVFISLPFLQHELKRERQANTILISENPGSSRTLGHDSTAQGQTLQEALRESVHLEDLALRLRLNEGRRCFALESASTLLSTSQEALAQRVAASAGIVVSPIFTYLANSIDHDSRRVPYSLVSGLAKPMFDELLANRYQEAKTHIAVPPSPVETSVGKSGSGNAFPLPPIVLNNWTAEDLKSWPGDTITLEYFVWEENGLLSTKTKDFCLQAIVPIRDLAADRDLAPEYAGITDSESLSDWDPPFPLDLRRIRPKDEEYWKKFKTTPKGFIPLEIAQQLWKSRLGAFTSIRFYPQQPAGRSDGKPTRSLDLGELADHFAGELKPLLAENLATFSIWPLRREGAQASQGATDFGAYFTYFSFFLVLSAVALAGLFFRFGLEQRIREIGTLRSLGFSIRTIKCLFLIEGILISALGGMVGIIGAWGFSHVAIHGLKTWWIGAVHTKDLSVHITSFPLWVGFLSGIVSASLVILFSLRMIGTSSPRTLLSGAWFTFPAIPSKGTTEKKLRGYALENNTHIAAKSRWWHFLPAISFALIGLLFLVSAQVEIMSQTPVFFCAGTAFLIAGLSSIYCWFRDVRGKPLTLHPPWSLAALGFRNLKYRPARSLFSIALITVATFIIVSVDAFRQKDHRRAIDKKSGTGGFVLQAESLLPIVYNLNQPAGRSALNLEVLNTPEFDKTKIDPFRVHPGDDTSCLNLYQPRNPRILAPTSDFLSENRFTFHSSLASTPEEMANPWILLTRTPSPEVVPTIVDSNSLNYSLHLKLGDEFILNRADGSKIRLRIVAALADSLFQSEMLISETNFQRFFPGEQGYRFFLIDPPHAEVAPLIEALEERLSNYGFDVGSTADRLAHFHQVENTYLSTFQTLGGLGLFLGSFGLVAVLLRNIVENRRQLGLLRAIGYTSRHLIIMVSSENVILLFLGLAAGTLCALVAIIPAIMERGGQFPSYSFAWLVPSILLTGVLSSLFAAYSVLGISLVTVLKSD